MARHGLLHQWRPLPYVQIHLYHDQSLVPPAQETRENGQPG
jgi:hypothetical protein